MREYEYHNLPIGGGGFVTGIIYNEKTKGNVYLRTDIGGIYSLCGEKWEALACCASPDTAYISSPISVCTDSGEPNAVFSMCGKGTADETGYFGISKDCGRNFVYKPVPTWINGNCPGRATGERLYVRGNRVVFGSRNDGLLFSDDLGNSWTKKAINGEKNITFVDCLEEHGILIVGTSGSDEPDGNMLNNSVYVSYDFGESFSALESLPKPFINMSTSFSGFTGTRSSFDGRYLYICFNCAATDGWWKGNNYSCDSGDIFDAVIMRYELKNGILGSAKDVTPYKMLGLTPRERALDFGFGGLDAGEDGRIIASTICRGMEDFVFVSENYGEDWRIVITRRSVENYVCKTPYLAPANNDGFSAIHWISDVKTDPFDRNTALFNSGTGVFRINNVWEAEKTFWEDFSDGIEETVHLNVYSPPDGKVILLDAVGDLGGFAFTSTDEMCKNTFCDKENNRFITVINIDYSDSHPEIAAATPRGNWGDTSKGGVIVSDDGGLSWTHTAQPYGISDYIDRLTAHIETPNVNSGWVAVSADGKRLVWTLCTQRDLPLDALVYSPDFGASWHKSNVFDLDNRLIVSETRLIKTMSDRVDPCLFYGFGECGELYVSRDGGESFHQRESGLPLSVSMGYVDGKSHADIRCETDKTGVIWIAADKDGLWRVNYNKSADGFEACKITSDGDIVYAQGMGRAQTGSEFHTLFIAATLSGEYGFWRSVDGGKSWERINTDRQLFGKVRSMCGDYRRFGRVYLGTNCCGVLYGDEV